MVIGAPLPYVVVVKSPFRVMILLGVQLEISTNIGTIIHRQIETIDAKSTTSFNIRFYLSWCMWRPTAPDGNQLRCGEPAETDNRLHLYRNQTHLV